jgi:multidrug efflux pump subunit AcrB
MNLPGFALKYKPIVLTATVLLVVYGMYVFATAPRKEDPSFVVRDAWIITAWPGATAEEVERFVTDPIETQLAGIKVMRKLDSTSYPNISVIQITTVDSVSDANAVWDKVRRELKLVEPTLPPGTMTPYLNDHASQASVMMLCMYQEPESAAARPYDPKHMEEFAKRLRDRILDLRPLQREATETTPAEPNPSLPAYVERLDMFGVQEEVIFIETDLGKWSQLGLDAQRLTTLLEARNLVVPGGSIDTPSEKFQVQTTGSFDAVREIQRMTVARVAVAAGGGKIDQPLATMTQQTVGTIETAGDPSLSVMPRPLTQNVSVSLEDLDLNIVRGYRDPPSSMARFGDTSASYPCIALAFTMKPNVNIVELDKAMAELLDVAPKTFLPPDIKIVKVSDQPVAVNKKVNEVVGNVVTSIVVVILVLVFMAGLRNAAIAAMAIPAIMLIAIGLMRIWNIDIEQVSLAALIVALGVLVDNTIQVSNNTQTFLDNGHPPEKAAVNGPNQIGFPTFIATATILAAFYPMTFCLDGPMREYAFSLPMVICLCLSAGWLFAMTVTCITASKMLKPGGDINPVLWLKDRVLPKKQAAQPRAETQEGSYQKFCALGIRAKWITLGGSYGFLILMLLLPVPSSFFPKSDRNQFVVDVFLPESAPIQRTSEVQSRLEDMIRALNTKTYDREGKLVDLPNGEHRLLNMGSLIGTGGPYNFAGLFPENGGNNYGIVWINTVTGPQVPQFVEDIRRAAYEGIGQPGDADYIPPITGARIVPKQLVTGTPVKSPIDIRVLGPRMGDDRELRKYAEQIKTVLRDSGMTWDVHDSWGEFGRQLDVEVDQDKANLAGVTNASVLLSMNAYYSGHPLTRYREGDKQIPIMLRLPPEQRGTLEDLDAVFVQGATGKVPLNSIAKIERRWVNAKINRYQRERNIAVRARPVGNLLFSEVLQEVGPQLDQIQADMPPGYRIEQGGTKEEADKGMRYIMGSLAISGVCIFFLLVVQFNSVIKPFMILLTLPLAAGGGLLGLYLMGIPMGFMEAVGMLALFGIVLSAAILLIEFSEILIKDKLRNREGLAEEGEPSFCGLKRDVFRGCLASAGQLRLMPILMTTLTTVGGLLSLMLAGGPLFKGLATVIVFGLSIGTGFTLFFLPALYAVFVENFGMKVTLNQASDE